MDTLKARAARIAAQRDMVLARLVSAKSRRDAARAEQIDVDAVQRVVQYVAARAQTGFGDYVGGIVTKAMRYVFPDRKDDIFAMRFRENRGKTECPLLLVTKAGEEAHPYDCAGGGLWDGLSFALRCSMIVLEEPRCAPLLLLDEPFKFIHGREMRRRALRLLRNTSETLGIQMLVVHQSDVEGESVDESLDVISSAPGCAVFEVRKVGYEKSEVVRI